MTIKRKKTDIIVPLEECFKDVRGIIQPLVLEQINDVAIITSEKDAIRANHYHKTDWHYCYVVSGSLDYYYREVGATTPPEKITIKAGELFFTPNMLEHAMKFREKTVFIVMTNNSRKHDEYESDIVRVKLI